MDLKLLLLFSIIALSASAPLEQEDDPGESPPVTDDEQPNPEEAGYFEGDMVIDENDSFETKSGIKGDKYRWPEKTVSFKISETFDEDQVQKIKAGIEEIASKTCIKFKEVSPDEDVTGYVLVNNEKPGCFSSVGYQGKMQLLNLEKGCFLTGIGTVAHEFVHAIGFFHEQSRVDRDDYVTVNLENVKPGMEGNFKKRDSDAFGVPYDYGSLMHYGKNYFTKNKLDTIVPKQEGVTIGQRDALSEMDVQKLKNMYNC